MVPQGVLAPGWHHGKVIRRRGILQYRATFIVRALLTSSTSIPRSTPRSYQVTFSPGAGAKAGVFWLAGGGRDHRFHRSERCAMNKIIGIVVSVAALST